MCPQSRDRIYLASRRWLLRFALLLFSKRCIFLCKIPRPTLPREQLSISFLFYYLPWALHCNFYLGSTCCYCILSSSIKGLRKIRPRIKPQIACIFLAKTPNSSSALWHQVIKFLSLFALQFMHATFSGNSALPFFLDLPLHSSVASFRNCID